MRPARQRDPGRGARASCGKSEHVLALARWAGRCDSGRPCPSPRTRSTRRPRPSAGCSNAPGVRPMSRSVTSVVDGDVGLDGRTIAARTRRSWTTWSPRSFRPTPRRSSPPRRPRKAQPEWAAVPAPVRGRAIATHRPAGGGQRRDAGPAGHPARSASRTPRPSARCGRSSTPATSSSARAAGCTARPCRARCPTSSCSPSASPVGAVAVITAGNFPVAVPAWYIVPALLCGNTVVWKPAEYSAAAAAAFHELFVRGGGLPDGVFNIVHADGHADLRRAGGGSGRRAASTRSASPARPRSAGRSAH